MSDASQHLGQHRCARRRLLPPQGRTAELVLENQDAVIINQIELVTTSESFNLILRS